MEQFATWAERKRELVTVDSWRSDPTIQTMVERLLIVYAPKAHWCYHNAAKMCAIDPEIEYVVGWAQTETDVIEHAWNAWRGIHFDITREIGFEGRAEFKRYIKLATIGAERLARVAGLWTAPTLFDAYMDEVAPFPPLPDLSRWLVKKS